MKEKTAWQQLPMNERAKYLTLLTQGFNLQDIKDTYNQLVAEQHTFEEGGPTRKDWDNTLAGKLVNHVENPDSVGYQNGKWYAPTLKGYDQNQFGMGVDRNQTAGFNDKVKRDKNGLQYLTEADERELRYNMLDAANTSANKRYEHAMTAVKHKKNNISAVKDAAVISAIYNLGSGYVARGLFEDKDFMVNLFDGTDAQVIDRINEEYKKKGRYSRIKGTNEFLGNVKANGGHLFEGTLEPSQQMNTAPVLSSLMVPSNLADFENWSRNYLGNDYSSYNKDIEEAQNYLDKLNNDPNSNENDIYYATEDLNSALDNKNYVLEEARNQIINTPIGESLKNPFKNTLYRIMAQGSGQYRKPANITAAIKQQLKNFPVILTYTGGAYPNKNLDFYDPDYSNYTWANPNRDLNKLYLTGNSTGFQRLHNNSRGFTYKEYLKKTGYTPKTYRGEMIPDVTYIDPKYATAIYSLLGKHTYTGGNFTPEQDDVARYIHTIGTDEGGNLEIQASDIWDFYPGDWNKFWTSAKNHPIDAIISNLGARLLDKNGKPFILRDYSKIKFENGAPNKFDWLDDLPAFIGFDNEETPIFELPEFTVTASRHKNDGKINDATMGTQSFWTKEDGTTKFVGNDGWISEKKSTGGPLYPFNFPKQ